MIVHAGLIALWRPDGWWGILIEGPSGAGKSDLALRALDAGFRLVSDDRTCLFSSSGRLFGRAPPALLGMIEARGLGVVRERALALAEIRLLVRCAHEPKELDRMPDMELQTRAGVSVPAMDLWPLEHSAPAKLRRAVEWLGGREAKAYLARLAHSRPGAET
ncbi:MAG TPA: HPr kinase/phosphatase C-terminal domain-containing protein [Caulobacteraceae bacterium]|jgi:serine kinase of HPr protein (carbohydrate metabolism regulator)|nr:HPr kinase/phosphatase C-terminal domain-containing protein [Caulobacteraceae bacterium]